MMAKMAQQIIFVALGVATSLHAFRKILEATAGSLRHSSCGFRQASGGMIAIGALTPLATNSIQQGMGL
jgi:hypothetical protein